MGCTAEHYCILKFLFFNGMWTFRFCLVCGWENQDSKVPFYADGDVPVQRENLKVQERCRVVLGVKSLGRWVKMGSRV